MSDDHVTLPDDDESLDPAADAPSTDDADETVASPETGPPTCAECGTPIEPDQQYCLECGAPTPYAVPLRSRRAAGSLVVASLLALGIGGGALIYALTKEDSGGTVASVSTDLTTPTTLPTFPTFSTNTSPLPNPFPTDSTLSTSTLPPFTQSTFTGFPTTTSPTTFTTDTFDDTDTFDETDTDPTTDTDTTTSGGGVEDDDWTASGTKYTIILRSSEDRTAAEDYVDEVRTSNFTAGLIVTDNYSSLTPGYYAVFHGVYDTVAAASSELARIKSSYPTAYVRRVAA